MQLLQSNYSILNRYETNLFWAQVYALIKGVINTSQLYKYRDISYDELVQIGAEAILSASPRFDINFKTPSGKKASLFNYYSLTVKKAIYYERIKRYQKTKDDVNIELYQPHREETYIQDNFLNNANIIIDKLHCSERIKNHYREIAQVIQEYSDTHNNYSKVYISKYVRAKLPHITRPKLILFFRYIRRGYKEIND
ncbi:MAG TPA: hypothetical protein P5098_03040 [Candidatus Dojkabacteria bacterium]|nr:hypothetical protein [Candidatus Dojkabacteria bacterium]